MPKKPKKQTIEALVEPIMRDAELTRMIAKLCAHGTPDKFVIIGVGHNGVGVVVTPGMSAPEALGALRMADDKLNFAIYSDK